MKSLFICLSFALALAFSADAQTMTSTAKSTASTTGTTEAKADAPKKRGPVFRATKAQIKEVQAMLKSKGTYSGEASGTLDDATRTSIKAFQKDNGLKQTGTLNRATLEKMNITLTDSQKAIPASPNSYASSDAKSESSAASKPRGPVFRANKDQIMEAQKMLKTGKMYDGEATGKLDDATRAGLKKYQEANGLKVTGTLNQVTLEKMGIALTDGQKAVSSKK